MGNKIIEWTCRACILGPCSRGRTEGVKLKKADCPNSAMQPLWYIDPEKEKASAEVAFSLDSEKEAREFTKKHVEPHFVPNCDKCRWMVRNFESTGDEGTPVVMSADDVCNTEPNHSIGSTIWSHMWTTCSAQGNRKCRRCYNSPECKTLFEVKECSQP